MMRRILCLWMVVLFLSNPAIAKTKKNLSPQEFTKRFYSLLYELKISGLPDADEFKMIAPFLHPWVRRLILSAKKKQEKYIKANPTNKPPWAECDLFSSAVEGISSYKVGVPILRGNYAKIPIRFIYREANDSSRWIDIILLKRINKAWVVSNMFYETNEEFNPKNSLRNFLKDEY
jgi:hypothetical protein